MGSTTTDAFPNMPSVTVTSNAPSISNFQVSYYLRFATFSGQVNDESAQGLTVQLGGLISLMPLVSSSSLRRCSLPFSFTTLSWSVKSSGVEKLSSWRADRQLRSSLVTAKKRITAGSVLLALSFGMQLLMLCWPYRRGGLSRPAERLQSWG